MQQWLASGNIAFGYCVVLWITGHQTSHLVAIHRHQAELNPLVRIWMGVTSLFGPAFIVWFGYEVGVLRALLLFIVAFVGRVVLVSVEKNLGITRNAWIISLTGLVAVPAIVLVIGWLTFSVR